MRDDRLQECVRDCRRGALVLFPLWEDVVGDRNRYAWNLFGNYVARTHLVLRVNIGKQHADGDGLDGFLLNHSGQLANLSLVKGNNHLPFSRKSLVYFETVAPLHERLGFNPTYIVVAASVTSLNKGYVSESGSRNIRDVGSLPSQKGIRRDRCPETEFLDQV